MKFKRQTKLALLICVILGCTALVIASAAGSGEPGSDADPLVTKSYVDQQIARLSSQISGGSAGSGNVDSGTVSQLQTDVGDLTKFVIDALTDIENIKGRTSYSVVKAAKGQTILLSEGTEVILRSGSATAINGSSGDRLLDATAGREIQAGASIDAQHIVISSRTDGRGLNMKSDSFLIIKGAYTIK